MAEARGPEHDVCMPARAHLRSQTVTRPHVVIAGGGVAAIELALALDDLAGRRVRLTLIAPHVDFERRSLLTAAPFSADHGRRHPLRPLADRVGAELIKDAVVAVDAARHLVRLADASTIAFDALVVAVGACHNRAYSRAITFDDHTATTAISGLLADLEGQWTHSVAFVVPPGDTWPAPLYELALMTARALHAMCVDDARLQLFSPEQSPLAVFGPPASRAVADLLEAAAITFSGNTQVLPDGDGRLRMLPGDERLVAERVVALPTLEGPHLEGVPSDARGFIPVDHHGRVLGLVDVYAAGDATDFPVKQGGLACQQADAVAEVLAASAGADVEPQPFRPVLRAQLLTGHGVQHLEHRLDGGDQDPLPQQRPWAADRKIDGRYLSPWLREVHETGGVQVRAGNAVGGSRRA